MGFQNNQREEKKITQLMHGFSQFVYIDLPPEIRNILYLQITQRFQQNNLPKTD